MLSHIRSGEDGFTLVELLVAMALSTIVLLATLQSLDVFSSNAAQQTRVTDANEQVRSSMDRTVADLRGASVVLQATANDLVYSVSQSSTTTSVRRLCVFSGDLYGSASTVASSPPPTAPATACGTAMTRLASLRAGSSTAFTYDGASSVSTALAKNVKNIGLKLSLDTSGGGRIGASTLEASAARRAAVPLPITDADVNTGCDPVTLKPLLSLDAGIPNVAGLTVTYTATGGVTTAPVIGTTVVPITLPAGVTTVVATITDALGLTTTVQKDVTCA
ncbi:MAG: prepilin-type N-terminal cleavage/methylation domain-containing protein [Mycobacteriales bacterium]